MSDLLGEAVYAALTSIEAGVPVYIAGQAPVDADLPFLTYQRASANAGYLTTSSQLGRRRIYVDVFAALPSQAEELADQVEEAMGQLSVAGSPSAIVMEGGFDRAEGVYRFNDYPEVMDDGSRVYRIVLTFDQREQLPI